LRDEGDSIGMADRLSVEERSRNMAKIRSRDTGPEVRVRRAAHALGLRFRLHRRDLPGTPDLVFPRLRVALFVNGCFWHRHEGCAKAYTPKTRIEFWQRKFDANVERDARKHAELTAAGWTPAVIWECETGDAERLAAIVRERVTPAASP
jgi:DNA mismatch endonuclease, patch repair protein